MLIYCNINNGISDREASDMVREAFRVTHAYIVVSANDKVESGERSG